MQSIKRSDALKALSAAGLALAPGKILAAPQNGGTFVMDVQPEPPTLGAYMNPSQPIGEVTAHIYDGLCEYDFNIRPVPSLATSWKLSPDGKSVSFTLRKGVKFHDGTPFTSADVQFSIMEVLRKYHPRGINTFRELESIDTPDPYTAVLRFNTPAPYVMLALSGYESPIVPKHLFENTDIRTNAQGNGPIGTGPFKFVEWKRGQYVRLDRNPDYWRPGQPHLDRIVVRFIADAATRTAALQTGEINYAAYGAIPYQDVARLTKIPGVAATTKGYEMQNPIVQLDFNTRVAPFNNVKVRQAISYAINRKFVIDHIWFGYGKPATGPINSNLAPLGFYTPDVKNYNVQNGVAMANKLLDEAGFPRKADGTRFEIVHDITPYGEVWQRYGEYVKQTLADLGIKATLRYEDLPTWIRRIYTDYDFQLTSNWFNGFADPVIGVDRQYSSWTIKKGVPFGNGSGWSSPETDKIMKDAAVEIHPKKRAELYHQLQKLVVEAAPVVWVFELHFVTMYSEKFHDITVSPLGDYAPLNEVWLST